jgi:hypothetical protein
MKFIKTFEAYNFKKIPYTEFSIPGENMEIEAPNGVIVSGVVERVSIDIIIPTEEHATDPDNETAKGYASGYFSEFPNGVLGKEISVYTVPLINPNQLPPIILSSDNMIIDGNNRYGAAKIAELKEVNVIRVDKTYKKFYDGQ